MINKDYPPVKVAVMIDGGFFVKRFNALYNKDKKYDGAKVADLLYTMAMRHVGERNTLYRIFLWQPCKQMQCCLLLYTIFTNCAAWAGPYGRINLNGGDRRECLSLPYI